MKVLYDYAVFYMQRYGGISTYFVEIMDKLDRSGKVKPTISDFVTNSVYSAEVKTYVKDSFTFSRIVNLFNIKKLQAFTRRYNDYLAIRKIKKGQFDIFHPTYYATYFLPYIKNKPFVLTVHDMVHEKFPENFPPDHPVKAKKKLLIEKASRIIAISNNTKQDIIDLLDIDPDKIDVIYHGIDFNYDDYDPAINPYFIPEDFILYVGERKGYKNFARFINVFARLHHDNPNLKLVCTGHPFAESELELFNQHHISTSVFHCFPKNSQELSLLYKKTTVFVYPSLYEGFGIPILEAFSCNCPVVLSNTSCFPEIAADAAAYFDPLNEDDMYNSVKKVITDTAYKAALIEKGKHRLKDFSWEKAANETYDVYIKALNLTT